MIKSNWPIKNLIISSNLIFMQMHLIIIWFNLEVQLGSQFCPKFHINFSMHLKLFLACSSQVVRFFILKKIRKKSKLDYDTYNNKIKTKHKTMS